jgi:hypothetical protein
MERGHRSARWLRRQSHRSRRALRERRLGRRERYSTLRQREWEGSPRRNRRWLRLDTLFDVAVVATNGVWAIGGQPPQGCCDTEPALIEHWNAVKWSVIPHTPDGILYGVSAAHSGDVWAIGDADGAPLITHWDGISRKSAASGAMGTRLSSVAARATDGMWAVGSRHDQTLQQIIIQHWDGSARQTVQVTGPGLSGIRSVE